MFPIDHLILLGAILILLGILSSKLSARLRLPVLVLFLLVGMLAGEDGVGIAFDNPEAAHALGTLALALILFDGGLQTPLESITRVWKPASLLATLGVLVTATVTGLVATLVLDLSVLEGLLLGAIVGSTDAAAVFSLFRNAGVNINSRLKSTLEIESASNDPMAIFLTVGLLDVLVNDKQPGLGLLQLFVMQMGIGAATGLAIGWLAVKMVNRVRLTASGLYLVMMTALGLLAFGIAANLGGSGFLAIFIAAGESGIPAGYLASGTGDSRGAGVAGASVGGGTGAAFFRFQSARDRPGLLGGAARFGAHYSGHLSAAVRSAGGGTDLQCGVFRGTHLRHHSGLHHALGGTSAGLDGAGCGSLHRGAGDYLPGGGGCGDR